MLKISQRLGGMDSLSVQFYTLTSLQKFPLINSVLERFATIFDTKFQFKHFCLEIQISFSYDINPFQGCKKFTICF